MDLWSQLAAYSDAPPARQPEATPPPDDRQPGWNLLAGDRFVHALHLGAGDEIGEWTLLEYRPGTRTPRRKAQWHCRCSCGTERWVAADNLTAAKRGVGVASRSCGHTRGPK